MITNDAKRRIFDALKNLAGASPADRARILADHALPDATWSVCHPWNEIAGVEALERRLLAPFAAAFPDLERRDDIFMAGAFRGGDWIASTGHYCGTFVVPLAGIPATGALAFLRYGEFYRLEGGRIAEAVVILDLIDLMRQAGVNPLPPAAGIETLAPGPRGHDGVRPDMVDAAGGGKTNALVEAMIAGLMEYDGATLDSMRQERFWSPDMLWFGPGGIGSNRRLKGFQDFHQRPFLTAFPDRRGGNHRCRIGDGMYVASTGWPSIRATHAGPYLGAPATGRPITMRVMDFWRRDGELLAENWVFIDLPDLFLQFGIDLFARMGERAAEGR